MTPPDSLLCADPLLGASLLLPPFPIILLKWPLLVIVVLTPPATDPNPLLQVPLVLERTLVMTGRPLPIVTAKPLGTRLQNRSTLFLLFTVVTLPTWCTNLPRATIMGVLLGDTVLNETPQRTPLLPGTRSLNIGCSSLRRVLASDTPTPLLPRTSPLTMLSLICMKWALPPPDLH